MQGIDKAVQFNKTFFNGIYIEAPMTSNWVISLPEDEKRPKRVKKEMAFSMAQL